MSLQEVAQKVVDGATADPSQPTSVPCAVVYVSDKTGKEVAWAAGGVKQIGSSEPIKKDSIFWIASCTKLVTAIAALQLVEQSKVNLQDPVTKYVPEFEKVTMVDGAKPKKVPTVWNCLTHTIGVNYPFMNKAADEYQQSKGRTTIQCIDGTKTSIMGPYTAEPDTEWHYGYGLDWAGQVIEAVSGLSLNDYFQEHIFKPLGIKEATFLPKGAGLTDKIVAPSFRNAEGKFEPFTEELLPSDESKLEVHYGGAGLYANASEYCQILVALLNGGTHPKNGGQILKPESVEELHKGQFETGSKFHKDLERPWITQDARMHPNAEALNAPGLPKNWAFGGARMLFEDPITKRSDNSLWWAGIQNSFWWCDFKDGTCGMVQTQIAPFFDMGALTVLATIENQVHTAYAK